MLKRPCLDELPIVVCVGAAFAASARAATVERTLFSASISSGVAGCPSFYREEAGGRVGRSFVQCGVSPW